MCRKGAGPATMPMPSSAASVCGTTRAHRSTGAAKKQNRMSRARGGRELEDLDLLVPNNRAWASNASALAILISDSLMRPSGSNKEVLSAHSLDAGTVSGYLV